MKHQLTEIDEALLDSVVGGVGECSPEDPNGDGVTTDAELENAMLYYNNLL